MGIAGFGVLGSESWVGSPGFGFVFLGLDSWIWTPGFGFLDLQSWVCIPCLESWFGFLSLDFWVWSLGFGFLVRVPGSVGGSGFLGHGFGILGLDS